MRLIRSLTPAHWESRQQCSLIRHPHLDEWIEKGRERWLLASSIYSFVAFSTQCKAFTQRRFCWKKLELPCRGLGWWGPDKAGPGTLRLVGLFADGDILYIFSYWFMADEWYLVNMRLNLKKRMNLKSADELLFCCAAHLYSDPVRIWAQLCNNPLRISEG